MIPIAALQRTAEALMAKAAIEIPDDYLAGLRRCADTEKGDLSSFVIQAMLENYEAAKEDRRAMCGDTGVPRWYVKYGNDARVEGGPVALEAALRRATANATTGVPLRPNRVHPLWRTDHNNNVGINAPEIEYAFHPHGDWVDLTTVHKGGLFGSDYRMLFPGDGLEGIRRFFLDTLIGFGKRGLACQPAIVGIGLGGSKDTSMVLGKQASCLRTVGSRNPDPKIAAMEEEFRELGNSIGMGAMGFMGSSMVVDCHIEVGYCHTGGMPMSVHMFCLSSRRATARIHADGRAEFRTDPDWFTDYSRRDSVEWGEPMAALSCCRPRSNAVATKLKTVELNLPASREDLATLEIGTVVYLNGRLFTAREGRLQASDRGRGRHAGRQCRPRHGELSLLARGRDRAGRPLQRRGGHGHRLVPLRQVARRVVQAVGLQHHHRQGRDDERSLPRRLRAQRRDLLDHRRVRHRRPPRARHPGRAGRVLEGRARPRPGGVGARRRTFRAVHRRERPRRQLAVRARERQDRAGARPPLRGHAAGDAAPLR